MEIALTPELIEAVRQRYGVRPARDVAMSTSVGGIGPLLRERILEQGDHGIDVVGVTLLYDNVWIQSWFDWGQLHLEKREAARHIREFLQDTGMMLSLPMYDGTTASAKVWKAPYGKSSVYFLDFPEITQVVYPSDEDAPAKHPAPWAWAEDMRYKHSWLVGRGALALAKALNFKPDIAVLSETPTIFGHHRIAKDDFQQDPFFENTRYAFNDHTPLEYAHPVWQAPVIQKLKLETTGYTRPAGWPDKGDVDITRLLIARCEGVFGVAQKHGRVMRAMPSLKDYADKIEAITNGVLTAYWQAPEYAQVEKLSDDELLRLRQEKKNDLLDWVWRHYGLWHTWKDQVKGKGVVVWTRRLTGYKRMDLLLGLCKTPAFRQQFLDANLVLLIGGRIHQHDDQSQTMVYNLLDALAVDKPLQERIVFLDNFNVGMAPKLFHGTDAAIMMADDGREASATGFMKAQMNGQLIIATDDGAIPESVIFAGREKEGQTPNGFEVPYVQGHPTVEGLMKALKALSQTLATPAKHLPMIRSAFGVHNIVSVQRTAEEMAAFYQRTLSKPLITLNQPTPSK